MRKNLNNKPPLFFDYVDFRAGVFERMYQKRLKGYGKLGLKAFSENEADENFARILENEKIAQIFSPLDYWEKFLSDCENCKKQIFILSPYINASVGEKFLFVAQSLVLKGIKIVIKTKRQTKIANELFNAGAEIFYDENLATKFCVIDEKILWHGSFSPLDYSNEDDRILRIADERIAGEVMSSC